MIRADTIIQNTHLLLQLRADARADDAAELRQRMRAVIPAGPSSHGLSNRIETRGRATRT